jgi:flagellar basal body-associated protein FliL
MIWLFIIVVTVLALLAGAVAVMWWRTEVAPRHTAPSRWSRPSPAKHSGG